MEQYLTELQALIAKNNAITPRTPWLEVSLGALQTALDNANVHVSMLAKMEAKKAAAAAPAPTAVNPVASAK